VKYKDNKSKDKTDVYKWALNTTRPVNTTVLKFKLIQNSNFESYAVVAPVDTISRNTWWIRKGS
jgi:hypothetical protein